MMPASVSRLGEFGLIGSVMKYQNLSPRVVRGIGDDAAVLKLDSRRYQLFTTDMLVEGAHFTRRALAPRVGHKALACSISDIAAMGGWPTAAVVSIGVAPRTPAAYVQGLYAGMASLARKSGVSLVGGDTVRAEKLVINVALLGEVEKKNLILRDGARPGDVIFVSGPLGGTLRSGKHLDFTPRVKEARYLATHYRPSAMMDISDGLAGDLRHILQASGAGAVIEAARVPLNPGVTFQQALAGGEDFELLFTLPAVRARRLMAHVRTRGAFRFWPVGRITGLAGKVQLQDAAGRLRPLTVRGYAHF